MSSNAVKRRQINVGLFSLKRRKMATKEEELQKKREEAERKARRGEIDPTHEFTFQVGMLLGRISKIPGPAGTHWITRMNKRQVSHTKFIADIFAGARRKRKRTSLKDQLMRKTLEIYSK